MIIKNCGDHYEVLLNHLVTLGKEQPLMNFKQYLQDIYTEFDKELTKTLYFMTSGEQKIMHNALRKSTKIIAEGN